LSDEYFYFKKFKVRNTVSALKVNTDGVLLGAWAKLNSSDKILEVGTGSGVISLMLNQRFSGIDITAIDIDEISYKEASFNVELNEASNIKVIHKSFQNFSKSSHKFDHIVSNPPYFQNSTKPDSQSLNLAKHTAELSFSDFWDAAESMTHAQSSVSVVLPFEESLGFIKLATDKQFGVHRQLNIRPKVSSPVKRVLIEFRKSIFCSNEMSEMFMHHEGQHNYTEAYKALTQDFYLAF